MPDIFLTLKLVHILAAIAMVGATMINGMIHAHARSARPVEAAALLRIVIRINAVFMGPSLIVIPSSGLGMMQLVGYDWRTGWLVAALALSLALLLAFGVGDRIERRLHGIASQAACAACPALPREYQTTFSKAALVGGMAMLMSLGALTLMIFKPF